jgi:hypothetical protein
MLISPCGPAEDVGCGAGSVVGETSAVGIGVEPGPVGAVGSGADVGAGVGDAAPEHATASTVTIDAIKANRIRAFIQLLLLVRS